MRPDPPAPERSGFFSGKMLQRTLHNSRITILCGVVTILVLRGTIGSGVDKTHFLDLTLDMDDIPDVEWDPSVPFTLGPTITNWDEQRAKWISKHPGENSNLRGKDRMLLVTGSQPKQCENPVGNFQLLKALKNKIDYCRLHDIDIFYNIAHLDIEMAGFWAKLPLLRKLLLAHPEIEWIWWMDSDALFTDMTFEIPIEKYKSYNMVLHGLEDEVYDQKSWLGLNTGSFLFRNCQWSLDLLEVWARMGPKGPVRVEAGKLLTATLAGRPEFEADDQSALVYLLAMNKEKWGSKVFLEHSYCLHGYWVMLVERLEELMELGPRGGEKNSFRWPFVTHFVGCKPCGRDGTSHYATDRCLKHMERAFNFADNQILEHYGFHHQTLNTYKVHQVRNDSSDPLGISDRIPSR
ncbi:probable xyloglucan 6-xylosyltransferase 3 [Physcomitrium patens]|uniref:Xyloglucan 6-xylosyltransferase n=1 Tax=Physcomitrium patens TaxID=3218 RepID=A9SMY2_PHYPA|nr:probable xyloglucan 6-xylosyltransferase 3 [Physcomitrium patens]XP_024372289.1 probable xyloglucan 6-xylosyltransferase 3 [Physcomitrium patens]PNR58503.1 hypothetical protein PHYPA_005498 [Physcomitrium patens]|eukprot:XP_024372288.1 probable xyloglucan 6-xylosyltransferase 3 [Physcomitrella patens]